MRRPYRQWVVAAVGWLSLAALSGCGVIPGFGDAGAIVPWAPIPPAPWDGREQVHGELRADVSLPEAVHPGDTVRYTVTLRNVGDSPAVFVACPAYEQALGSAGRPIRYQLNCQAMPSQLPVGTSVMLEMFTTIPLETPIGMDTIVWSLEGTSAGIKQQLPVVAH